MKAMLLPALCVVLGAAAWCQAPTPAPQSTPVPGTPQITLPTPAPAPQLKPDTVVASMQGKPVTAGEIEDYVRGFPPQVQNSYKANPREVLRQYMIFRYVAALAEKNGLDRQSPTKQQLEFLRTQALWQAQIAAISMELNGAPEDFQKYYDEHKDKYTQAKVKAIYLPFSSAPPPETKDADPKAKKALTEAQAKERAEEVVKLARSGSDFGELVKKYSEDPQSSQKGGELPPISKGDQLPEALKTAIFALKKDEVSEPVRHTNGYYVFRGEGVTTQTMDQVRDQINQELKSARMRTWMEKAEKEAQIKFENEGFFAQPVKIQ